MSGPAEPPTPVSRRPAALAPELVLLRVCGPRRHPRVQQLGPRASAGRPRPRGRGSLSTPALTCCGGGCPLPRLPRGHAVQLPHSSVWRAEEPLACRRRRALRQRGPPVTAGEPGPPLPAGQCWARRRHLLQGPWRRQAGPPASTGMGQASWGHPGGPWSSSRHCACRGHAQVCAGQVSLQAPPCSGRSPLGPNAPPGAAARLPPPGPRPGPPGWGEQGAAWAGRGVAWLTAPSRGKRRTTSATCTSGR